MLSVPVWSYFTRRLPAMNTCTAASPTPTLLRQPGAPRWCVDLDAALRHRRATHAVAVAMCRKAMKRKTEQADAESPPRNYQNLAQNALCTSTRSPLDFLSVLSMTAGCATSACLLAHSCTAPRRSSAWPAAVCSAGGARLRSAALVLPDASWLLAAQALCTGSLRLV